MDAESEESDWSTEEDSDSDSEPELVDNDDDSDTEARKKKMKDMTPEQVALASLMLSKRKKRLAIDDAYNRNAYNDDELPEWFMDDEKKHRQANIPVTKEDMQIYREKMKEIDARPIKKVAEAKARKKHKLGKKMERVKRQAAAIADSEDITEKQKLNQIMKLYKSKTHTVNLTIPLSSCLFFSSLTRSSLPSLSLFQKKPEIKYVVAKGSLKGKSRPGVKGKYRMVDPRLKKDKKAQKRIDKKNKSKRRK